VILAAAEKREERENRERERGEKRGRRRREKRERERERRRAERRAWAITSSVTEGWSWEEFSRWTDYYLSKILGCTGD
jgi:hypothetical protein